MATASKRDTLVSSSRPPDRSHCAKTLEVHAVTDIGISVVRSNGYLDFIPKALLRTRPNASMEMVVRSSDSGFSDL